MSGEDVRRDNTVGEEIEMDGGGELRIEVADPLDTERLKWNGGGKREGGRKATKPLVRRCQRT